MEREREVKLGGGRREEGGREIGMGGTEDRRREKGRKEETGKYIGREEDVEKRQRDRDGGRKDGKEKGRDG